MDNEKRQKSLFLVLEKQIDLFYNDFIQTENILQLSEDTMAFLFEKRLFLLLSIGELFSLFRHRLNFSRPFLAGSGRI